MCIDTGFEVLAIGLSHEDHFLGPFGHKRRMVLPKQGLHSFNCLQL